MTSDRPRLLVLDVDSTLIQQEVIELIAARAGTQQQVAEVTERAMRGELDFAESLRERVATLRGVPDTVFAEVADEVTFSPGAEELVSTAMQAGWTVALVSGGFEEVVGTLAARLSITRFVANRLAMENRCLTGVTVGPVIDRAAKAVALTAFARAAGVDLSDSVAIGDGANDLDMMAAAGTSVAFRAKPAVRAAADHAVDDSLAHVWPLVR